MGKSPGKWIKAVLFGKKSSKSQLSKGVTGDKRSSTMASVENLAANAPIQNFDRGSEDTKLEKGTNTGITCDNAALSSVTPDIESQVIEEPISGFSADDAELKSIEQAATKAQAAFRGYLARRAFRALKGIIRLQALIRGHLVRRQAVATLRCMQAVVRVQALARGRRVRLSDCALRNFNSGELKDAKQVDVSAVNMSVRPVKLTASAFVCKLLAAVPMAMPLSLQYDECEPNSVWQWLERWSLSHFWEPLPKPKKVVDAKSQKKQAGLQTVEIEPVRSRRSVRKVFSAAIGDANTVSSSEPEKPRRNIRTVTTHQIEPVQDQPQNELERVKWNLRKVTGAMATPLERSETEYAKAEQIPIPAQTQAKTSFAASNVGEAVVVNSSEETSESNSEIEKLAMTEAPTPVAVEEPNDVLHDHPTVEQQQLEEQRQLEVENVGKSENSLIVNEELSSKEDQTSKERTRRRSLPSKQENSENISQNTPSVPSYMAATKSAKAKLKAQGSPIVSEEGAENGVVRRHSLPSSTNGKFSSLSPRVQRPVQANGKSGNKNSRSLSASKDEKVLQPGWKR